MSIPNPEPGLVISYAYLWHDEHRAGLEEGQKDRPSVIVLAVERKADGATLVTVSPITHTAPRDPAKRPAEWEVAVERPTYDLTIFKLRCGKRPQPHPTGPADHQDDPGISAAPAISPANRSGPEIPGPCVPRPGTRGCDCIRSDSWSIASGSRCASARRSQGRSSGKSNARRLGSTAL